MPSAAVLAWLSSSRRSVRLWRAQPDAANPAEFGDVLVAQDMLAAGVPLADIADALAVRLPREPGWTADVVMAAATAPPPQRGQPAATNQPQPLSIVACLRQFSGPPTSYEFTVDGSQPFTVDSDAIAGPMKFATACIAFTGRVPSLPLRYAQWGAWLNPILDAAERVQESPDTTDDGHEREVVAGQLALVTPGDGPEDLCAGKWLANDGHRAISLAPLLHMVKARLPTMTPRRIARRLRELGWTATKIGTANVWQSPEAVAAPEPVAAALDRVRTARLSLVPPAYADDDRPFYDEDRA